MLTLGSLRLPLAGVSAAPASQGAQPVVLYFFWGEGCPHCAAQEVFLQALAQEYPNLEVRAYEVYHDLEGRALFLEMARAFGFEPMGVPTTFVGERYWVGYSERIAEQIRAQVATCSAAGCPDAGAGLLPGPPAPTVTPRPSTGQPVQPVPGESNDKPSVIVVPLLGTIDLAAQSLTVSTALIAFVDGFNPCSLWVLTILLSLILRTGSRKKVFAVGLTFLLVTALIYGLFIGGLFTILAFISYLRWIQVAVALIALFFATVNIKDYFWYKEGLSLTISDEQKPGLYRRMREIMRARSVWGMITATVVMAAGVALVELPCTAGLPMLWTGLVAANQVSALTFGLLLALYMVIYLADELALFLAAVVTLRVSRLQETHGRILKLVGGALMLTLALVMLVNPALMSEVSGTLLVFGAALALACGVLVLHRMVLPLVGIRIGDGLPARRGRRRPSGR